MNSLLNRNVKVGSLVDVTIMSGPDLTIIAAERLNGRQGLCVKFNADTNLRLGDRWLVEVVRELGDEYQIKPIRKLEEGDGQVPLLKKMFAILAVESPEAFRIAVAQIEDHFLDNKNDLDGLMKFYFLMFEAHDTGWENAVKFDFEQIGFYVNLLIRQTLNYTPVQATEAFCRLGYYMSKRGCPLSAERYLMRALKCTDRATHLSQRVLRNLEALHRRYHQVEFESEPHVTYRLIVMTEVGGKVDVARRLRVAARFMKKNQYDAAIKILNQIDVQNLSGDDIYEVLFARGKAFLAGGWFEKARDTLKQVYGLKVSSEIAVALAEAYVQCGEGVNLAKAVPLFRQALELQKEELAGR